MTTPTALFQVSEPYAGSNPLHVAKFERQRATVVSLMRVMEGKMRHLAKNTGDMARFAAEFSADVQKFHILETKNTE